MSNWFEFSGVKLAAGSDTLRLVLLAGVEKIMLDKLADPLTKLVVSVCAKFGLEIRILLFTSISLKPLTSSAVTTTVGSAKFASPLTGWVKKLNLSAMILIWFIVESE